jgi:hypothetical protein
MSDLRPFCLLACTFFLSTLCEAASVTEVLDQGRKLRVDISDTSWRNGRVVCAVRDQKRIACGLLVEKKGVTGIVGLDFRNQMPLVGDVVLSADEAKAHQNASRGPASVIPENDSVHYRHGGRDAYMVGSFVNWDIDQLTMGAALEFFVAPRITYAVEVSAYDVAGAVSQMDGYSLMLRRSFRPTRNFTGVYLGLAAGAYFFTVNPGTSATSFVLQGNVGWAVRLARWLNLSMGVGITYFTRPNVGNLSSEAFRLLRPGFGISLGVPF